MLDYDETLKRLAQNRRKKPSVSVDIGPIDKLERTAEDGSQSTAFSPEAFAKYIADNEIEPAPQIARVGEGAEMAEGGARVSGDSIPDKERAVSGLVASVIGEKQERPKVDAVAEALKLASSEAQKRRGIAADSAREEMRSADIGDDSYFAYRTGQHNDTPGRKAAARAHLARLMDADAASAGTDGDQLASRIGENEKTSRAEAAALEMVKREREEKAEGRRFATSEREAGEKFRAGQGDLERASELERARLAHRGGGAGKQPGAPKPGTNVPGMDIAAGAEPTAEDAKKVKATQASAGRMRAYVKELRDLHSKYGTEYGGKVGNRMQQLSTQIVLEGKNIAELGALSGPDMGLMEAISQADPGSLGANLKGMVGIDNTQGALEGLDKWLNDQVSGTSTAYGYAPKQGAPPGQQPAPGRKVKLKDGRVGTLSPDGTFHLE